MLAVPLIARAADTKIDWFLQPVWDNVTSFSEGLAAASSAGLWGYINPGGRWVIEPRFADAWPFHDGAAAVQTVPGRDSDGAGKWGYINTKGNFVIPPRFDFAAPYYEGRAAVRSGDKWGYIDVKGQLVIDARFNLAGDFHDGLAVVLSGSRYFFIDRSGKPAFSGPNGSDGFDGAWPFADDRAAVLMNGKIGFINREGKLVIPPQYQPSSGGRMFSEGLAGVRPVGNAQANYRGLGYINVNGDWAIEPSPFENVRNFSGGLGAVRRGGRWGFIDTSGQQVIPCRFEDVTSFSEGVAGVATAKRWGYINRDGDWLLDPVLLETMPFSEGLAAARSTNGHWGYVARSIAPLFDGQVFDNARSFCNGLAAVRIENKWGCIDQNGELVLPAQFDGLGDFHDGLAPAKSNGRWGYIDLKAKWPIKNIYAMAWPFSEGLAAVQTNTKKGKSIGYINPHGETVIASRYGVPSDGSEAGTFTEGLAAVLLNGKTGFIDAKGNVKIKANFKPWKGVAPQFRGGVAEVTTLKGQKIFIDRSGRQVSKAMAGSATFATVSPWRAPSGLWGYKDADGLILVPPFLEHAEKFSEGKAAVSLYGKWWYIRSPINPSED